MKKKDIAGSVLAGGRNTRMPGLVKSYLRIRGLPIIERTVQIFERIFADLILITNTPELYPDYMHRLRIHSDIVRNVGPLGGIHASLTAANQEFVFVAACDMPFLDAEFIEFELACCAKIQSEAFIPRIGEYIEPLHAVYRTDICDVLHRFLREKKRYAIRSFLETIDVHYWDLPVTNRNMRIFTNLNTPQDVERLGAE